MFDTQVPRRILGLARRCTRGRLAWARLNADTLFLALLATFAGLFDLIEPTRDAVVVARDGALPLFHARAGGYVLAGLVLTVALLTASVRTEVIARCILVGAIALNIYRHVVWLGWETDTQSSLVLLAIVILTSGLRFSVLLDQHDLLLRRGPTNGRGDR